ncbi:hypothetical protein KC960_05380 [Candidatus Saccharibacteria bacterium]|nr:hypothetical protein [Candidatus Saccharibacteria bacterium]
MNKTLVAIFASLLVLLSIFLYLKRTTYWTWSDYQECANAGGATQESNPPVCFNENGDRITPGSPKN